MRHIRLSKFQSEELPISLNMLNRCGDGEYPVTATVTCNVSSGTDLNPNDILDGSASVVDQQDIRQHIAGGLPGVIYDLQFAAETNLGSIYIDTVHIAIIPDGS